MIRIRIAIRSCIVSAVPVKAADLRRLSRSESKARTRERVLDAAEAMFAAEGFGGASLDRIADAAALTRGAIYSSFSDKADLFAAVLDRRLRRRVETVAEGIAASGDAAGFVALLRSSEWSAPDDPDALRWSLLYDEFRLFALRNPAARERLARHERYERDRYADAIRHYNEQAGTASPVDERLAAAILLALDHGLVRQHRIDPDDVPPTAFADALEFLVRAAAALSPPRRRGRR